MPLTSSPSSVITAGYGPPGSAYLVITDGFGTGAAVVTSIGGRSRRKRWRESVLVTEPPTARNVAEERKRVEEMLAAADAQLEDLIGETKVLKGAIEEASGRQVRSITAMIDKLERRIDAVIEDEDVLFLLTQQ